jgi:hypothetical protein
MDDTANRWQQVYLWTFFAIGVFFSASLVIVVRLHPPTNVPEEI